MPIDEKEFNELNEKYENSLKNIEELNKKIEALSASNAKLEAEKNAIIDNKSKILGDLKSKKDDYQLLLEEMSKMKEDYGVLLEKQKLVEFEKDVINGLKDKKFINEDVKNMAIKYIIEGAKGIKDLNLSDYLKEFEKNNAGLFEIPKAGTGGTGGTNNIINKDDDPLSVFDRE